jgi:DNA-binding CsgD family transcriptional regulator
LNKALEYLYRALDTYEKTPLKKGKLPSEVATMSSIARISAELGDNKTASKFLLKTINHINYVKADMMLANVYDDIVFVEKKIGAYELGLKYSEKYAQTKERLWNENVQIKLNNIDTKNRVEKVKSEIEKKNKELVRRNYLIVGIFCFFVILIYLIVRNIRVKLKNAELKKEIAMKEKKFLEQEISGKNEELQKQIKSIVEKNEFLENFQNKIKEIQGELNYKNKEIETFALSLGEKTEFIEKVKEEVALIKKKSNNGLYFENLLSMIRNNMTLTNDKKEVDMQIEVIQQSFLFRLESLFPTLSKSEKRLATLLYMDLSTKEIAAMLNITIDGVKKSRIRLRKKLGMDRSQVFLSFFKVLMVDCT